jgi:hypothetical protein
VFFTNIADFKINDSLPTLPPHKPNRPIPKDLIQKGLIKDSSEYKEAMDQAMQKYNEEIKKYNEHEKTYDPYRKVMKHIIEESKQGKNEKEIRQLLLKNNISPVVIDETFSVYYLYKDFDFLKQGLDSCFIYFNQGKVAPVGEDYPPLYERLIPSEIAPQMAFNLSKLIYFFPDTSENALHFTFLSQSANALSAQTAQKEEKEEKEEKEKNEKQKKYDDIIIIFKENEAPFHIINDMQARIKEIQQWANSNTNKDQIKEFKVTYHYEKKSESKETANIKDYIENLKSTLKDLQEKQENFIKTKGYIEKAKTQYIKGRNKEIPQDVKNIFNSVTLNELKQHYKKLSSAMSEKKGGGSLFSRQTPEEKLLKRLEKDYPEIKEEETPKIERKPSSEL